MSEERSDQKSVLAPDGAVVKRPWHPPDLQEVDVVDTEAGSGLYMIEDASTYMS